MLVILIEADMPKRGHYLTLNRIAAKMIGYMPRSGIHFLYNRVRNMSGYVGLGLRYACIKNLCKTCGENVAIFPGCIIKHLECLSLGDNVSIHHYCFIDAIGGIEIEDNVSVANHCSIISFSHTWDDENEPIKYNKILKTPISIKSDVWIACGVRIIGPCNINSRTIIGAGAVVKGILQGQYIYGGIPAKIIKKIGKDFDKMKIEYCGEYNSLNNKQLPPPS